MIKIKALERECQAALDSAANPIYTYKVFDIEDISHDGVKLMHCTLALTGTAIAAHLKGCEKAVLLGATIGVGADTLIRKMQIEDMAKAVITDRLAGFAIERLCNELANIISDKYSEYKTTTRFSPGYGDFPLEAQKGFSEVLRLPESIGVYVSGSMTLTPSKSVTAVIGLRG